MATPSMPVPERSVGELVSDLSHQLSTLLRQEVQLARTEVAARGKALMRDVVVIGIGAALAYTALTFLAATIVLALIEADVRPWVAALIVTVALAGIGGVMVMTRLNAMRRRPVAPVATIESVKETAQWIKKETVGS